MRKLFAAAFVVALSVPAWADPAVPTGYSVSGPWSMGGSQLGGPVSNLWFIDGQYVSTPSVTWATGTVNTISLTIPAQWGSDLRVFITANAAGLNGPPYPNNVWEIDAVYSDGVGTSTYQTTTNVYLEEASTVVLDSSGFTAAGGFNPANVNNLTLTFTNVSGGPVSGSFQFDRISNPEPAALALFGLGAFGLGGLAWKRRKARRAAAKA